MRFRVRVPVLSEQMNVTDPSVSTADNFRISAFFLTSRFAPPASATVISAGISASVDAVHRVRLQTHAANLAISIMSELKIGARPLAAVGPENLEAPFQEWLYRVNLNAGDVAVTETDATRAVEVIVWHTQENIVHRTTQHFRASDLARAEGNEVPQ